MVHLLLEKGQSPAAKEHVPVTPQCTLSDPDAQSQAPEKMMKKMTHIKDYSFVTEGQTLGDCHLTLNLFLDYLKCDFYMLDHNSYLGLYLFLSSVNNNLMQHYTKFKKKTDMFVAVEVWKALDNEIMHKANYGHLIVP